MNLRQVLRDATNRIAEVMARENKRPGQLVTVYKALQDALTDDHPLLDVRLYGPAQRGDEPYRRQAPNAVAKAASEASALKAHGRPAVAKKKSKKTSSASTAEA